MKRHIAVDFSFYAISSVLVTTQMGMAAQTSEADYFKTSEYKTDN